MYNRIKNRALNTVAFAIFVKEQFQLSEEEMYERQIAESQAKIGPYKHHPCPVQIWA
jgi:hypothetical protein